MTKAEAIERLRNESCKSRLYCELYPDDCMKEECEIYMAIEALKERPKGKWILQDTSYWRATHAGDVQVNRVNLKCSFCGWRNHEKKNYNFCPNCGSRMRGEE